jgi:ubiquinone/menaquinone biosynthesis C-methylase UbiE
MGSEVFMDLNNCRNLFPLRESRVLDIGCGQGEFSWKLMKEEGVFGVEAIDADINLVIANQNEKVLPGLNFSQGRAEKLDFEDNEFDLVVLIKSFHHVPIEQMNDALHEIVRVTKPSGHIYISEPSCEGAFNDLLVMFYDERIQRAAAANSIESFMKNNVLTTSTQGEHVSETVFDNFEHFNNNIIQKVTHGVGIETSLLEHVKAKYETYADNEQVCFKRKSIFYKLTK